MLIASNALGIGAASFFREGGDEAEKDRAESPTRSGTPKKKTTVNGQQTTDLVYALVESGKLVITKKISEPHL